MNINIMTENGEIILDSEVVAKCAGAAACECFGIVGMAAINVRDGLAKLLKVENLSNGVNVRTEDDNFFHGNPSDRLDNGTVYNNVD